jgi:hypothetical protein
MKPKPQSTAPVELHQLRARCLRQISQVLDDLEDEKRWNMITSLRLAAIDKMTRLVFADTKLGSDESSNAAGSTLRKYSGAFQTPNASRGRATKPRLAAAPTLVHDAGDIDSILDDRDDDAS